MTCASCDRLREDNADLWRRLNQLSSEHAGMRNRAEAAEAEVVRLRDELHEIAKAISEPGDGGRSYAEIPAEVKALKAKLDRVQEIIGPPQSYEEPRVHKIRAALESK